MSWQAFEASAPDLAHQIAARFASHQHGVMATLRRDGSPRLSGMEIPIRDGQLWLAIGPTSRKAQDLARNGAFALHSAPDNEEMLLGDARIDGIARPASDSEFETFCAGNRFAIDDPSKIAVFVAEITGAYLARVSDARLLVETWSPDGGLRQFVPD